MLLAPLTDLNVAQDRGLNLNFFAPIISALRAIPCDFYFALCFLLAYWRPNWVKGGGFSGEANP